MGGRRIDQRKRGALAHRHRFARVAVEVHQRHRDVGYRHLPRADHRIARTKAADGAIADRHQERLVGNRRELQHVVRGFAQVERPRIEGLEPAREVRDIACHFRRLAEQDGEVHVHGRVVQDRILDAQPMIRRCAS